MGHSILIVTQSFPIFCLFLLQTSKPLLASPTSGLLCHWTTEQYDCTSTENTPIAHFSRLRNTSECRVKCQEKTGCKYFTFNIQPVNESNYPGACFLFTSCTSRRAGANQWVSGVRVCHHVHGYHGHNHHANDHHAHHHHAHDYHGHHGHGFSHWHFWDFLIRAM